MEKRYIGIDLHRNRFTCCIRLENERTYLTVSVWPTQGWVISEQWTSEPE